jgi:beta-galactosidase GanA
MAEDPETISTAIPKLVTKDGRHALMVDGAPFLVLGAQVHNSSNYPDALPEVWPLLDRIHANTVEVPIAWQQVEPLEGRFDLSFLQTLLDQARVHDKRVVLIWFGTWKNTSPSYTPAWFKLDNRRFPRMKTKAGEDHYVHSPHARATLEADKRAFVKVMEYLRDHDQQNTVIMVQPENEVGSYRNPRDYGTEANRLFAQPIPPALARATRRRGAWTQAFGAQADRAFNTWYTARFVDELAAAGRAVKPLPMFVNASLAGPTNVPDPMGVASGGPQQDVLDIWKAAAPSIVFAGPDIYDRNSAAIEEYLKRYARPDNALMVPEIGNAAYFGRFFYSVIGHGGIGFGPFGIDDSGYSNHPLGAATLDNKTLDAFALPYATLAPISRDWARIAFEHPTWGVAKPDDGKPVSTRMGDWNITATWGEWQFGERSSPWLKSAPPPWANEPIGGAAIAQLTDNTFLVVGDHVRLAFGSAEGTKPHGMVISVEQGSFRNGIWVTSRVWNGDRTDYGINLVDRPAILRVTMGHYR